MSRRFDQLSAHHCNLLARIAVQRRELEETAEEIEHELGRVDRGITAIRRALSSPALMGGAIAEGNVSSRSRRSSLERFARLMVVFAAWRIRVIAPGQAITAQSPESFSR